METHTFDGETICREYQQLPHGSGRVDAIQAAIHQADGAADRFWQLKFRYDGIYEYAFHGDCAKALPMVAEYAALFEERTGGAKPRNYLYVLYIALGLWSQLPQLPLDQRKELSQRLLDGTRRYRLGDTWYHQQEWLFARKQGDQARGEEHYQQCLHAQAQTQEVCPACFRTYEVEYALECGQWERALQLARPILDGSLTCGPPHHTTPSSTYAVLLDGAIDRGDWRQARQLAMQLLPYFRQKPNRLDHACAMMRWLAHVASARGLERLRLIKWYDAAPAGLHWLGQCSRVIASYWGQDTQYRFHKIAWVFCASLATCRDMASLQLPKDHPLYREDGQYRLASLAAWSHAQAEEIGGRFDRRNGFEWYARDLQRAGQFL